MARYMNQAKMVKILEYGEYRRSKLSNSFKNKEVIHSVGFNQNHGRCFCGIGKAVFLCAQN